MQEGYRKISNVKRCINIVESIIPRTHPAIQCRDDSGIHSFDIAMENISIGIAHYFMVDRVFRNVRFRRTRSVYSTYISKRHHGLRSDMLTRNWWIVLDKSKCTLQFTTQDNLRSALKPLTRRYRTYLLQQRLRQLKCRFIQTRYFQRKNPQLGIHVIISSLMGDLFK